LPVASFVSRFIFRMRRATPFACNRSTISHKCRTYVGINIGAFLAPLICGTLIRLPPIDLLR
jgi:hypothetical protein